jgi:hypothetical protein
VVGFNIPMQMPGILRALRDLHTLRGFEMSPAVEAELEYYVMTVLRRKVSRHAPCHLSWRSVVPGSGAVMPCASCTLINHRMS